MRAKKVTAKEILRLDDVCKTVRKNVLEMAHRSNSPHTGPAFSCVEILVALYHCVMRIDSAPSYAGRGDRFILSKGHGAMSLYACLSALGFFDEKKLFSYCANGGGLAEHPLAGKLQGIEFATGSLGHGLAIGMGMALASRLKGIPYNVYVLMGDGECNEGSVWEAAGLASSLRLDNLIAIIDSNKMQATDSCDRLSGGYRLEDVWRSFGWRTYEVDGHDLSAIIGIFDKHFFEEKKPKVVMANTVKGKGVSFMENDLEWHYRAPDAGDLKKAFKEIDGARRS